MILRDYQTDVVKALEQTVAQGVRKILMVAPTGAGKTVIASAIIRNSTRRVLVVAHRREIVNQTSDKLTAFDVQHGIIQAGDEDKLRPMAAVQVASIQTLHARAIRSASMQMPLADLLIIDEAHHACAATYRAVLKAYPDIIVLGLTATPCRGDGRGLGGIFSTLIECPQIPELIESGYLVRTRVYAPVDPDLRGVQTRQGDYVESQLAARMDREKLVGEGCCVLPKASPTPSSWIIPGPCSVTGSLRIAWSGRSIPTGTPLRQSIRGGRATAKAAS
jgi:DNA repair protein RadD